MTPSSVLESYLLLQLLRNMVLGVSQSLPARAWSTGKATKLLDYRAAVIDLGKVVGKVMSMGPHFLIH